jgi:hypothetical protein
LTDVNVADDRVMRGFPPPPEHRVRLDQVYAEPRLTHWYMQHAREMSGTADVSSRHAAIVRLREEPMELDDVKVGRAGGDTWTLTEMLRGTCADGIIILRQGRMVFERYFHGMRPGTSHLYQSVTKALASCVAANLVEDGSLGVDDEVAAIVPELAGSAYGDATVRHLLDMSVGIKYEDELDKPEYDGARLCRLEGVQPAIADDEPGSAYDEATRTHKEGEHGALFHYVSLNTFVLGWAMERATGLSVPELIRTHVWSKLGTEHDAYILLDGAGSAQLEGGFASSLRDMARFGLMLCQGGGWTTSSTTATRAPLRPPPRNGTTRARTLDARTGVASGSASPTITSPSAASAGSGSGCTSIRRAASSSRCSHRGHLRWRTSSAHTRFRPARILRASSRSTSTVGPARA